jgi:hypothetical protein
MIKQKVKTKKEILEEEERQLWIAIATAVARAEVTSDKNSMEIWANKAADAFKNRYNNG